MAVVVIMFAAIPLSIMVDRITQLKAKVYAYSREGNHGSERKVVFASGAQLTRVRETHIAEIPIVKSISSPQTLTKIVPAMWLNLRSVESPGLDTAD